MTGAPAENRPRRRSERAPDGGRWHWWAILTLTALSLVLGLVGFARYGAAHDENRSAWDVLYLTIQLFALQSGSLPAAVPWELNAARFLAPIVPAWALVRALLVIFGAHLRLLRVRRFQDHVVVYELVRKGLELVRDFHVQGGRVVVLERDPGNEHLALCRSYGVPVILQSAADPRALRAAGVERARHVIAITGDDGANVAIAALTYRLVRDRAASATGVVHCWVQVVDLRLATLLAQHRMLTDMTDRFIAHVFNPYESSARLVLHEHPLDHVWIGPADGRCVQLIVVGFGQMGECLTLQAARMAAYANGRKIRLTVIDRAAQRMGQLFRERYAGFETIGSIDFIEGEASDPALLAEIERRAGASDAVTTVAICFDDDSRALSCALDVLPRIRAGHVPLLVRMANEVGLAALLESQGEAAGPAKGVHPFGIVSRVCNRDALLHERLDALARALHETYVGHRLAENVPPSKPSLQPWEHLDEAFKESSRQSADHIPVKLRAVRCHVAVEGAGTDAVENFAPDEIELLARMEHARWHAERLLAGWRPGEASFEKRTTPHFVGWDKLDEPTRQIDRELVEEIPRVVKKVGERVYRQG